MSQQQQFGELIEFPKLIDSSVTSGIITLNDELKNTKEKQTKITLNILDPDRNNKNEELNFFCDYSNLVNINYKLKSTCTQIEESIKHLANK